MEDYKLEECEEEDTVLVDVWPPGEAGGQLQESQLPRVLNREKENGEHFKSTHLEQIQYCTDLPLQVAFSAQTEQGKTWPQ